MPSPFFRSVSSAYWDTSGPRFLRSPPRTELSLENSPEVSARGSPSMEGANRRTYEGDAPSSGEPGEESASLSRDASSPSAEVTASPLCALFFFPGRMWHRAASAWRISSRTSSRTRSLVAASRTEK